MLNIAALVVLSVLLFSFFEVTSQPGFCGSCHLMEPYIEAWKHSSHNEVHCLTCHAREGVTGYLETKFTAMSMRANYATGLYKRSRPWAEIEDKNCLQEGCHSTRLLEGKIEFTKGVIFDHTPHLTEERRGRTLRCTSCHSQIVQGEHISVTSSTCYICHFKNVHEEDRSHLSECTLCHTPPVGEDAFSRNKFDHNFVLGREIECQTCHKMMWQGTGNVSKERCGVCHSEAAHIDRIDDLDFIHEWHIEKRKVDCQRCHSPIEHSNPGVEQVVGGDCSGCHEQLHNPMLAMYEGSGSRLVEEAMPNVMHESGAVCMSCHKELNNGIIQAGINKKSCTPCHSASFLKLAKAWHKNYDHRIKLIETELKKIKSHPQLEAAYHDLNLLKNGGTWHNPKYATVIIAEIAKVIEKAGGRPPNHLPKVTSESEFCLTCHAGITDAVIERKFSNFSHEKHIIDREMSCRSCHWWTDPEKPGHGRVLEPENSCMDCHHGKLAEELENCQPCHQPSRNMFFGDIEGASTQPSPMAESGMVCLDCHDKDRKYAPYTKIFCMDCHDQETGDEFEKIRLEFSDILKTTHAGTSIVIQQIIRDNGRAVHHPDLARRYLLGDN